MSGVLQGLVYLKPIALLPILTLSLGPEIFGVWSQLIAFVQVVASIGALGLGQASRRHIAAEDSKAERKSYFWTSLWIALLGSSSLALLISLCAPPLADHLLLQLPGGQIDRESLISALRSAALLIPLLAISPSFVNYYRSLQRPKGYGSFLVLDFSLTVTLAAFLSQIWNQTLWIPIVALITSHSIILLLGTLCLGSELGISLRLTRARVLLTYGIPLIPVPLLLSINNFADRYLLGLLLTSDAAAQVGRYSANYSVGGVVAMLFSPFFLFLQPAAVRLWKEGQLDEIRRLIRHSIKYCLIVVLPVLALAPHLENLVIAVLSSNFGVDWPVLLIIMCGLVVNMLNFFALIPFSLSKETGKIATIYLIAAVCNVVANIVSIPLWGIYGAAISTLFSFTIMLLSSVVMGRRILPMDFDPRLLLRLVACAGGASIPHYFDISDGLKITLTITVYAGLLMAFRCITLRELKIAQSSVSGFFGRLRSAS